MSPFVGLFVIAFAAPPPNDPPKNQTHKKYGLCPNEDSFQNIRGIHTEF
jgi:hypothetical protein